MLHQQHLIQIKKLKGTANNYYYKLGFKPVNKKALNKAAKGIEVKQLWEEQLLNLMLNHT
jgi:hypothetical protein